MEGQCHEIYQEEAIINQHKSLGLLPAKPKNKATLPAIKPGSRVWVKEHALSDAIHKKYAGFEPKWSGPFVILKETSPDVFSIEQKNNKTVTAHRDQLKLYYADP